MAKDSRLVARVSKDTVKYIESISKMTNIPKSKIIRDGAIKESKRLEKLLDKKDG